MADFDIVFEGGGAKGVTFVGALNALIERGHSYRRIVGTSAGAITATLCAAGYSPDEMLGCINQRTNDNKPIFSTFMDKPKADDFDGASKSNSIVMKALKEINLPWVPDSAEISIDNFLVNNLLKNGVFARLFSFAETGGFYSGRTFLHWLQERLAQKQFDPNITLFQLHQSTGRDLSLVATNVTLRQKMVLNHRTAPNLPVCFAVRMSMSIPFVWQEVNWQENWDYNPLSAKGVKTAGTKIVDGGVLSNFPMDLIAESGKSVSEVMGSLGQQFVDAAHNLGLLIDEDLPVDGQSSGSSKSSLIDDLPTLRRVQNLVETMMGARDNSVIGQYEGQICRLPAAGYGTLEFDMEGTRLDDFVKAGHQAMTKHLTNRGF